MESKKISFNQREAPITFYLYIYVFRELFLEPMNTPKCFHLRLNIQVISLHFHKISISNFNFYLEIFKYLIFGFNLFLLLYVSFIFCGSFLLKSEYFYLVPINSSVIDIFRIKMPNFIHKINCF